jgi:selenide,water dikinase
LPQEGIAQVVRGLPRFEHEDLLVGTEDFSDAGVFRLRPDLCIVQSLDFFPPLVDDPFIFGQIAATNSLSDIYAMGAIPRTALNIVGFPDDELDLDVLNAILKGGAERIKKADALLIGGHTVRDTEIKYGLSVTGTADPNNLLTNAGAKPGHLLLLTKPLGTGFITTANKKGKCPEASYTATLESMIRLNAAAGESALALDASSSTDITGFGLAGHAREMASASNVTLAIDLEQLPLLPEAVALGANGFRTRASKSNFVFLEDAVSIAPNVDQDLLAIVFDPQTSGGLLVALPEANAGEFMDRCEAADGYRPSVVGSVQDSATTPLVFK